MLVDPGFANLALVEEVYEKFRVNPSSVDPSWQQFFRGFDQFQPSRVQAVEVVKASSAATSLSRPAAVSPQKAAAADSDARVYNLIEAYRTYGHLIAKINPIQTHSLPEPRELSLEAAGFKPEDLDKVFPTYSLLAEKEAPLVKIIQTLREIYCQNVGVEYKGLGNRELELWLQQRIEPTRCNIDLSIDQKQMILHDLNKSELLESFLHTKYVGQKRFSLEGGETLIPMLSSLIDTSAHLGMEELVIGMAHRGRLNVLSNIFNKSYVEIFSEFDESYIPESFEGSGDVKYHKGFTSEVHTRHNQKVRLYLLPNASHLESVDPIVEGQAYALQRKHGDDQRKKVVPVLIHGDAAVAGQGVVYETLQLSKLSGYATGGTLHIVINNQIGFTTLPKDARSTRYCTDIAKAFGCPVFHVNAEDPEACVFVTNLAVELRQKFHCDVFIDLICYRKYGHNESDEPAYTQPVEYQAIRKKRPIREIYREELIHHSFLEKYMAEQMEVEFKKSLQKALTDVKIPQRKNGGNSQDISSGFLNRSTLSTAVPKSDLQQIATGLSRIPSSFNIHPKLLHLLKERFSMVMEGEQAKPLDWGMAETLAYGSLLWQGMDVRLTGQDCCRGTFSHRHAVLMDQVKDLPYYPLKQLKADQGCFEVINSPLSEFASLGFELGFSLVKPQALVIWEAQFGDFANGAQTIIDQYIASGEEKWMQKTSLTLFLPHGYEGQGPDHSSGRMERFLQLAGRDNMRIVNPSTPAQHFHLLRSQALDPIRKPLIVFTPKGLLRHPGCVSALSELTQGGFSPILDDPQKPNKAKTLIFCSGRIYYDLSAARAQKNVQDVVFVRIEQLYPLDKATLKALVDKYKGFSEVYWVQEEPANMGAWEYMRGELSAILPKDKPLQYIGRARSATTAVGAHAVHKQEHHEIIEAVFKQYDFKMPAEAIETKRI